MKIALMIYGTLDQVSGGYLYDRMMVDHLERLGHEVSICSWPQRPYALNLTDNFFRNRLRVLQEVRPHVLLQDELCHPSLFFLNGPLKDALGCPIIAIVHHLKSSEAHPAWQNAFYSGVEKNYLKTVDGCIFNSETTRAVVWRLLGEERQCVVAYPGGDHIASGIDDGIIWNRALEPGPLKLLFIGNVIPRKGLHTLIGALGRLADQDWHLTIVGSLSADRRYVKRIQGLISDRGLKERVDMAGTVDQESLTELLSTHHSLTVPSFYEGFGIVYLEAMAFGLPVIASTAGAVPEVVADAREGFLVPPGDEATLADCIGVFVRNRKRLAAMGLAARMRSLDHPSWAESAQRIHHFIMGPLRISHRKRIGWRAAA
jgi:glycosyltransferase involved in cell wall biosynthesis